MHFNNVLFDPFLTPTYTILGNRRPETFDITIGDECGVCSFWMWQLEREKVLSQDNGRL